MALGDRQLRRHRRAVLQVVGKRVDISLANGWGEELPRTRIVAIGAHGSIDGEAMRQRFDATVARAERI